MWLIKLAIGTPQNNIMKITISSPLELFNQLNELVKNNEAFYITDQSIDGHRFFIFNYRLASYSDFCQSGALNARGTMFEVDTDGNFIRLACLPFHKFFNLGENPFVMDLDLSDVDVITAKLDGSLISSYVIGDKLYLKTKGSLHSEQAVDAMEFIKDKPYAEFIRYMTTLGYTVNFEWISPKNRIVIGYSEPALRVLSIRDTRDGHYLSFKKIKETFHGLFLYEKSFVVEDVTDQYKDSMLHFHTIVADLVGIEGFVVQLRSGITFKIKTKWYCNLHHTKDSVNNPRRLFECVVNETTDDLRTMFVDDPVALQMINEMEQKVAKIYNHMVATVESFYGANKTLDRKSYAILGKEQLDSMYFGLAMSKYIGKEINWKEFMVKHYRDFGIRDEAIVPAE